MSENKLHAGMEKNAVGDMLIVQALVGGHNNGDFSQIKINGERIKVNFTEKEELKGLHIALINPENGAVEMSEVFNT